MKKFYILIPEIKPVEVAKNADEEKAAPNAESAGKVDESTAGTTSSPSKAQGESALKNGAPKAAPPVPAFKAPPRGKEDAPAIDSLFNYKPIF